MSNETIRKGGQSQEAAQEAATQFPNGDGAQGCPSTARSFGLLFNTHKPSDVVNPHCRVTFIGTFCCFHAGKNPAAINRGGSRSGECQQMATIPCKLPSHLRGVPGVHSTAASLCHCWAGGQALHSAFLCARNDPTEIMTNKPQDAPGPPSKEPNPMRTSSDIGVRKSPQLRDSSKQHQGHNAASPSRTHGAASPGQHQPSSYLGPPASCPC